MVNKLRVIALNIAITALLLLAAAARPTCAQSNQFSVPKALKERVGFWILVFSKYGKNQVVFHHRDDPGIIYSSLDFSKLAEETAGEEFERLKAAELEAETKRIKETLIYLAEGRSPTDAFERRLERLFERYGAWHRRSKYREAATTEKLRYQTGIRERHLEGLKRSGRYLYAIEQIFEDRGLPTEVAKLPFVESSFDYNAYSSVGAAGIWQFMRATAKKYMRVNSAIDERRDPIIATRAAAAYLQHAYNVLGTWPLALTSYNHGITGVKRAAIASGTTDIAKIIERYDGKSFGFASKNFYAEFLAALDVERNYRSYFPGVELEQPVYFDEIQLGRPSHYREILRLSGLDDDSFRQLNPALLTPVTKGRAGIPQGFLIKVPPGRGQLIINAVPGSKLHWESRSAVRKTAESAVNKLEKKGKKPAVQSNIASGDSTKSYLIQPGDTLSQISQKTGITVKKLLELNPSAAAKIKSGQRLLLE